MLIWAAISCIIALFIWKLWKCCKTVKKPRNSDTSSFISSKGSLKTYREVGEVTCCANDVSPSASASGSDSYSDYTDRSARISIPPISPGQRDFLRCCSNKSITSLQIEELRKSPAFMSDPLGNLKQAGASNKEIFKVLNQLSSKPSNSATIQLENVK